MKAVSELLVTGFGQPDMNDLFITQLDYKVISA